MKVQRSIAKEVHRLLINIDSMSDGQAVVTECDSDQLQHVTVKVSPRQGPYQGGTFKFTVNKC